MNKRFGLANEENPHFLGGDQEENISQKITQIRTTVSQQTFFTTVSAE